MIMSLEFISLETNFCIYIKEDIIIEIYIDDIKICNTKYYQHLTESFNHLAIYIYLDIIFVISKLTQFNVNSIARYLIVAFHILRYLKDTRNLSIIYKR